MDYLSIAFRVYSKLGQIQRLYTLLAPHAVSVQKSAPEITELIPKAQRLYDLVNPIAKEWKKIAPEVIPLAKEIMDAVAPEYVAAQEQQAQEFDARWLQTSLNTLGYGPVTVDGDPGDQTKEAIKKFQTDQGFPKKDIDGWAGTMTSAAIYTALAAKAKTV